MIVTVLNLLGCRRFTFKFFSFKFCNLKELFKNPVSRGSVSSSLIPVGCLQLVWAEDELEKGTYMLLEDKLIPNFSKSNQ